MMDFLLALTGSQLAHLTKLVEAQSAHDVTPATSPVPVCHEHDAACAREVRIFLMHACTTSGLMLVNAWCLLWPRDTADAPADAVDSRVLATDWATANRKYASSGGGYCGMRITGPPRDECHPARPQTVLTITSASYSPELYAWFVENTPLHDESTSDWDAHDAEQWSLAILRAMSSVVLSSFDVLAATFHGDRQCAQWVQSCPEHIRARAVTVTASADSGSVAVFAHVHGMHQTSAAIRLLFDERAYEQAVTTVWEAPKRSSFMRDEVSIGRSALWVAVRLKLWRAVIRMVHEFDWQSTAVGGAILRIRDRPETGLSDGLEEEPKRALASLRGCFRWIRNGFGEPQMHADGSPMPDVKSVNARMIRDAASFRRDVAPASSSYACHVQIKVIIEMNEIEKAHIYDDRDLMYYKHDLDTPARMLLLIKALKTGKAHRIRIVKDMLSMSLSVETCLDTRLVPAELVNGYGTATSTVSLFQACASSLTDTADNAIDALFEPCDDDSFSAVDLPWSCGDNAVDSDQGWKSARRRHVRDRVGSWKAELVKQAACVRSLHGLAWALSLPEVSAAEEAGIKRRTIAWFSPSPSWMEDPFTLGQALAEPGLALQLARWGLDPFVGHEDCLSAFESAFRNEWFRDEWLDALPGPPLAVRLATAYAAQLGVRVNSLCRRREVRCTISRVLSHMCSDCRQKTAHRTEMCAAIASLSNWRIWSRVPGEDPAQPAAVYQGYKFGYSEETEHKPELGPQDYDEAAVYGVVLGDRHWGAFAGRLLTTFSKEGRAHMRRSARWGAIPYKHTCDQSTRARVIECLVLARNPRPRANLQICSV